MNQDSNQTRPGVLDNVSETQIQELEQQYEEQDRTAWDTLTQSYGWSKQDGDAVWNWFGTKSSGQS
jgi:hypothetical protein